MRRLSAIAVLCLFLTLSASAQLRIVLREGAVKGNSYSNPSIGVSYEFPQGWEAETPAIPTQLTADPVTLLKAHPDGAADPRWVALQITALSRLPQEQRDPESFLQATVRTWNAAAGSAQIVGPLQKTELGDHDFERADVVLTSAERRDPMAVFAGAVNGFMFLFQAHAADAAQLGELADTTDSVRFFPPEGTEKEQPVIPVPLHDDPTAVKRVSVSETTARARIRNQVEPMYPPEARQRGVEGEVLIDLVVGADGRVLEATVLSGHPLLNDAALAAIKQWTFEPYLVNGWPVEIDTRIRVTFSLISAKTAS